MEIQLSKKLKSIRQMNNTTQEELALFLKISPQAVSKWERNEGYPDITLLPKIAGYFHVSVDELLGADETAKQSRINEITEKYNRIRHSVPLDPGHRIDEGIELLKNALHELPGVFFFEQLLASDLLWKGKNLSDDSKKTQLLGEAVSLCKDILARSNEDRWRDCAKQILLVTYADLGMTEKALELASQMPPLRCSCEYMLTYILKNDELNDRLRLNAVLFYQIFRESVVKLLNSGFDERDVIHENELSTSGIEINEYLSAIKNILP